VGLAVVILLFVSSARPDSVEGALAAVMIAFASILPTILWIRAGAKGVPSFAMYALTHLWTFALPLVQDHPIVRLFPPEAQLVGGASVAGFLLIATVIWHRVASRKSKPPTHCLMLREYATDVLALLALTMSVIFEASILGGWLRLPPGVYPVLRAIAIAVNALSGFVLSYRLGAKSLGGMESLAFKAIIACLILVLLPSLLLVNAMSVLAILFIGYTLGARRIPWIICLATIAVFFVLHAGKAEMRTRYWKDDEDPVIQPTSYIPFIGEWAKTSLEMLLFIRSSGDTEVQSLFERAGLMHLLLLIQYMTPDVVPYLDGATYTLIPELLVPRFFNPDKIRSHEGTYLLDIHYGLQTEEATEKTTIGFGLLNEAYANFGQFGLVLLAAVVGAFYGTIERWARDMPVLSLRSLFAVLVASYAYQSEFTAGVYVAGLFQSSIALLILAGWLVRPVALSTDTTVRRL
jgi:hypothetical protein